MRIYQLVQFQSNVQTKIRSITKTGAWMMLTRVDYLLPFHTTSRQVTQRHTFTNRKLQHLHPFDSWYFQQKDDVRYTSRQADKKHIRHRLSFIIIQLSQLFPNKFENNSHYLFSIVSKFVYTGSLVKSTFNFLKVLISTSESISEV